MPDIAMCRNKKCSKRMSCYRYIANPCYYQSYSSFGKKDCDYYIRAKPIRKFNDGMGAVLCNHCSVIIQTGFKGKRLLCDECKSKLR